jgi:hypothetical protein
MSMSELSLTAAAQALRTSRTTLAKAIGEGMPAREVVGERGTREWSIDVEAACAWLEKRENRRQLQRLAAARRREILDKLPDRERRRLDVLADLVVVGGDAPHEPLQTVSGTEFMGKTWTWPDVLELVGWGMPFAQGGDPERPDEWRFSIGLFMRWAGLLAIALGDEVIPGIGELPEVLRALRGRRPLRVPRGGYDLGDDAA